ncbi:hypothetical protein MY11210_000380 [Beauveria gryllotalpidicola]
MVVRLRRLRCAQRIAALRGCGYTSVPKVIEQLFAAMDSGDAIKDQDLYVPVRGTRSSRTGAEAAWQHFLNNLDQYCERFPPGLSMLKNLVKYLCENMGTSEQLSTFKDIV